MDLSDRLLRKRLNKLGLPNLQKHKTFECILLCFLALQPILDILTNFFIRYLSFSLSPGILIRGVFSLCALIYLLRHLNASRLSRLSVIAIAVFAVCFSILHLLSNGQASPASLVISLSKYFYVLLMFLLLHTLLVLKRITPKEIKQTLLINGGLYVATLILADLTGTSFKSYDYGSGSSGWFFSGNEISAIFFASVPLLFLSLERLKGRYRWLYSSLILLALAYVGTHIGTRIAYYSITVFSAVLAIAIALSLSIKKLRHRPTSQVNKNLLLLAALLLTLSLCLFQLNSPVKSNMNDRALDHSLRKPMEISKMQSPEEIQFDEFLITPLGDSLNKLMNDRLTLSKDSYIAWKNADTLKQVFGMSNRMTDIRNKVIAHDIESDYLAYLVYFGYAGLFLTLVLLCLPVFASLKNAFKNRGQIKLEGLLDFYAYSGLLTMAMFAGHTLSAPSVSVFVSSFGACLLYESSLVSKKPGI